MKIIANTNDKTIKEKTGKNWDEWINDLGKDNALSLNHKELFAHIQNKYKIDAWWAQKVAIGYEHITGSRKQYEKCSGEFEISKSRTFDIQLHKFFELIHNLLKESFFGNIEITTLNKDKNIRAKMNDNSSFSFDFYPKGSKTQLVIQHFKLNNSKHGEEKKDFWNKKLEELEAKLLNK